MEAEGGITGVLAILGHGVRKGREVDRLRNGSMAASKEAHYAAFCKTRKINQQRKWGDWKYWTEVALYLMVLSCIVVKSEATAQWVILSCTA